MYASQCGSPVPIAGHAADLPFPTAKACRKLMDLAVEQKECKHAATLAIALHSAQPEDAQRGLETAFNIAQQSEPMSEEMQSLSGQSLLPNAVTSRVRHVFNNSTQTDNLDTELAQGLGGRMQLMLWLCHQVSSSSSRHSKIAE